MQTFTTPNKPKVLVVDKIEVSDLIRAVAKMDPVRENPEYKKLLDMTLEEYDEYMKEHYPED
jgi:hypothetical protein